MDELLNQLRGCMETAKMFSHMDRDVKEESTRKKLFSPSMIDQIKAGRNVPDTDENNEKVYFLIKVYEDLLCKAIKNIKVHKPEILEA